MAGICVASLHNQVKESSKLAPITYRLWLEIGPTDFAIFLGNNFFREEIKPTTFTYLLIPNCGPKIKKIDISLFPPILYLAQY